MALRELVAKLGFNVDDKGAKDFTKTLDGLKQSVNTLAVAKLNQWAVSLEQAFEKTGRQLELIAKSDGFKKIQGAISGNKDGIFDQTQLRQAGVEFQKITGDAALFGKTLKASKEYATIVSETPQAISQGFAEFVASGATGKMQELGLVTQQQLERLRLSGREYGKWTTHARKVELMNIVTANAGRRQELYAKSLKNSDVQFSMLMGNFRKFGRSIGSFLAPALARVLGHVNDLFTKFQNSPLAQTAAKFVAIAGGVTLVASAILTAAKIAMLFLSPLVIKIAILSAIAAAAFLVVEDLYTYLTDPLAETWIGSLVEKFPKLGEIIQNIKQAFIDFKTTLSEDGVIAATLGLLKDLALLSLDAWAAAFIAAFDAVGEALKTFYNSPAMAEVKAFFDSIGKTLSTVQNFVGLGDKPSPVSNAVENAGNKIDSAINIVVNGASATANDVKNAVIDGVMQSPLGSAMKWIKGSDNMATGGG